MVEVVGFCGVWKREEGEVKRNDQTSRFTPSVSSKQEIPQSKIQLGSYFGVGWDQQTAAKGN